jgi:glycolate oxidase iron-sulfur subunit
LDYEALQKCIHCGFCIQACPTYRQTSLETASPRGRIALMRAVAEGKLPAGEGFSDAVNLCLGCRACETACPSGVQYGHLLEQAREVAAETTPPVWYVRFAMRYLFGHIGRLRALAVLARWAQPLGLFRLAPGALRELAEALPPLRPAQAYPKPGEPKPGAGGKPVLFFHGCVQEAFLQGQNLAALRVLTAQGAAVAVPEGQTCCGALHAHYGNREGARELARRNIACFERLDGPIVNHAGGCGAQLKEYGHLLADDPVWAGRAAAFAARVRDLSEWLVENGLPEAGLHPVDLTVTYQDSCHLAHGQKVRRQPRALIRAIPGVAFREMDAADQCCGSAGIYNLLQPAMSGRVLVEKMASAAATGAGAIITANPGCYLQVRQGVRRRGLEGQVEVLSLAELLDRSQSGDGKK